MSVKNLITIDGPSASGKSSVSRLLAKKMGWPWVSTGAFYRGLALASLRQNLSVDDEKGLDELASNPIWHIEMGEDTHVIYDGQDVTPEIHGENVGAVASKISQIPTIREALLQRQRNCYKADRGLVAEGRDCGTVVFPLATAKIYLTADPAQRALRRSGQDQAAVEKVLEMQKQRDERDSKREVAPLKVADGALQIDSSFLSLEEVVEEVFKYVQSQINSN